MDKIYTCIKRAQHKRDCGQWFCFGKENSDHMLGPASKLGSSQFWQGLLLKDLICICLWFVYYSTERLLDVKLFNSFIIPDVFSYLIL